MGFLKALFVGKAESSWFSVPGFKPHDMEEFCDKNVIKV